jgi:hypothetical protein
VGLDGSFGAGACSMHRSDKNVNTILLRKPQGKNHSEDLGVDANIILEWIWIHLAQDKDHWRNVVNTVINHRVP